MTIERDFDRIARAWLELSPDEAPDHVVAGVLETIATTPQVRPWRWLTWRSTPMNRIPLTLGAAAVVAIAGALVLSRSGPGPDVGSTPSPRATTSGASASPASPATPSGSPTTATGSVPTELREIWMGGHRGLVAPEAGTLINLTENTFELAQAAGSTARYLKSTASSTGDRQLRLELTDGGDGCTSGDVGTYSWSLSPSGRTLTIVEEQDACPTRAGTIVGDWWLMDCPATDDNCLGVLDAGTYKSQFITPRLNPGAAWSPVFGGVTYTVPDGWANSADWPEGFELVPATEVKPATEADRRRNIGLFTQPTAMSQDKPCADTVQPGVTRTVDALATWLGTVPGLVTTAPTAITIDGHPGKMLDLQLDPAWTKTCEGDSEQLPIVTFLNPGIAVAADQRNRVILLDLGDGDVIAIGVWARDQATFDAWAPEAMSVIETFKFK